MIVKLLLHKDMDAISIWNKEGDRLFYSDKEEDIKLAKEMLTIEKGLTDAEILQIRLGGNVERRYEQRFHSYFNAMWRNKIVILKKRAAGYSW